MTTMKLTGRQFVDNAGKQLAVSSAGSFPTVSLAAPQRRQRFTMHFRRHEQVRAVTAEGVIARVQGRMVEK